MLGNVKFISCLLCPLVRYTLIYPQNKFRNFHMYISCFILYINAP